MLHPYYTMFHPCSTFVKYLLNHVTALHPCNSFIHPYYTMLHPYNTFATSLSNHVTPLWHFCYILIIPCYTLAALLFYPCDMFHPCSTFVKYLLNHVTALHPCNSFIHPYYTMLHPYNTFATSLSNHVTPLWHFCYILIIPCYTLVTLLLHPSSTFAASRFWHCGILYCGILSGYHNVYIWDRNISSHWPAQIVSHWSISR